MVHVRLIVTLSTVLIAAMVVAWFPLHRRDSGRTTSLAVTGQLVAYEVGRQDLTLRTETGDRHFIVRAGTPVHEGARTLTLADLTTAAHCRVKVWYRDPAGRPVARDIRISCESHEASRRR